MSKKSVNIPEGYKMTELGPLPQDWRPTRLVEMATLVKDKIEPFEAGDLPYIGLEHIDSGDVRLKRCGAPSEVRSTKGVFKRGDVLYGKLRPYLDKAAFAHEDGVCSTDILIFRANAEICSSNYLVFALHTHDFLNHAISTTTGTNHPRTSWAKIKTFEFPLPPLSEQKKIAAVLSIVQDAKAKTEGVIAALRQLKKSLMKHLFTYGPVPVNEAEKVELKEMDLGPLPEMWAVRRLKDVAHVKTSTISLNELRQVDTKNTSDVLVHGIKVADMNTPGNEREILRSAIEVRLPESLAVKRTVPPGSVVFPKRGTAIATNKKRLTSTWTALDPNLIAVIPDHEIDVHFLHAWFLTFDISSVQSPGPTPQLNKKDVEPINLPVPKLAVQREIAGAIAAIDSRITNEEFQRQSLDELFKTLLHDLMTAKIRVTDLEVPV